MSHATGSGNGIHDTSSMLCESEPPKQGGEDDKWGDDMSGVEVVRANERAATDFEWLGSKHSFSFGRHYDPANTHHGLWSSTTTTSSRPAPDSTHPHRDMEIVTWVLRGSLVHQDSTGAPVIYPDLAQRMSAGRGILHSEKNDSWRLTGDASHREPVHLVQMWVVPDEAGITRVTNSSRSTTRCCAAAWSPSPGNAKHRNETAIHIRNRSAALHGRTLAGGRWSQSRRSFPAPVRSHRRGGAGGWAHSTPATPPAHRLGRSTGDSDAAIGDPDLGDARGDCRPITASSAAGARLSRNPPEGCPASSFTALRAHLARQL